MFARCRAASHAVAACLGLAVDAVACIPEDACQHTACEGEDAASQAAKQDAVQGIVQAIAELAASAAELVAELEPIEDELLEAGEVLYLAFIWSEPAQSLQGHGGLLRVDRERRSCPPTLLIF